SDPLEGKLLLESRIFIRLFLLDLWIVSVVECCALTQGRVVCVTFAASSVDEEYLKKLLGQFGAVVKVMMFPALALVEMGSKDQSGDIVKYFTDNPLAVEGKRIEFSISTTFSFLQSSRVVSFSPLPAGDGTTSELMAIAKRFGSVKTSLFLPSRGYVEMTDPADAKKLVEHFITKPLKLKGKAVQVTFSTEYDTLISYSQGRRRSSERRHSPERRRSPEGRHSSERRHSSEGRHSPERRHSSERNCSSRSSRLNEQNDRQHSRDKSKTLSKAVNSDIVASMDSDSDLEGLAVIADDGEELQHDDDEPIDHHKIDQEQKTCEEVAQQDDQTSSISAAFPKQDASSGREEVKHLTRQSQENSPSGSVGIPSVHSDVKVETLQDSESPKEENTDSTAGIEMEQLHLTIQLYKLLFKTFQEEFGKVLDVRNLPKAEDYTDSDFVNIAKRYGEVKHYLLIRDCRKVKEKYIMVHASDAERIAADSKNQDVALRGNALKIKVSVKYSMVDITYCLMPLATFYILANRNAEPVATRLHFNALFTGTEFVRPVVGYFCNLCNVIYASEEEAKDEHCRSPSHHEKLKVNIHQQNNIYL
uniref:RRM domain-containing protein n=1 Tax=Pygocentrus nattereri TaxID=42514 RepID=A0AAR2M4B3_PYGNA